MHIQARLASFIVLWATKIASGSENPVKVPGPPHFHVQERGRRSKLPVHECDTETTSQAQMVSVQPEHGGGDDVCVWRDGLSEYD